jgi:hypothetical protein
MNIWRIVLTLGVFLDDQLKNNNSNDNNVQNKLQAIVS